MRRSKLTNRKSKRKKGSWSILKEFPWKILKFPMRKVSKRLTLKTS